MTISADGHAPPKSRPGPKPRGRTVVPLTITVTHAQRAALDARADAEQVSISTIVRRFIAVGLSAGILFVLSIRSAPITHWRRAHHEVGTPRDEGRDRRERPY